jgi:hypothetical protein
MLISLVAFVAAFGVLLVLERIAHRMLQELTLLLAGQADIAVFLYSIPLLPGVALHELSHACMALLLGVQVRRVSLFPQRQPKGIVRLGAVQVSRSDHLRTSLIGGAPLLSGVLVLGLVGRLVFNGAGVTAALDRGSLAALLAQLVATTRAADALLWFYVVFTVANTMMPSSSDTQAWPPVIGFLVLVAVVAMIVGGANLVQAVEEPLRFSLRWLAAVLAITAFVDMLVIASLWLLVRLLERVTNRRIEYRH